MMFVRLSVRPSVDLGRACIVIRDCNPGVDFSIPGFGIGKIVWAYIIAVYGHGLLSSDHSFHLYR